MDREPPSPGSFPEGPGWPLRGVTPDWVDEAEWGRMCAARGDEAELPDLDEEFFSDPEHGAPGQWEELPAEVLAARAQAAAEQEARRARLIAAGLDGDGHRRGDAAPAGDPRRPGCRVRAGLPAGCAGPEHDLVGAGR